MKSIANLLVLKFSVVFVNLDIILTTDSVLSVRLIGRSVSYAILWTRKYVFCVKAGIK